MRKVESSCEQFGPFFICVCPKYIKFYFRKLGNGRKGEKDVDRLLLVMIMENKFSKYFIKFDFFSFSKPNVVYLICL